MSQIQAFSAASTNADSDRHSALEGAIPPGRNRGNMHKWFASVTFCIAAGELSAGAQVAGSGNSGTAPMFAPTSTVGNSFNVVTGGNVRECAR
jgi:hypothetical protein